MPTVYDVWRMSLPASTQLCTQESNLKRNVSWAHRMLTSAPAFGNVDENDFVLISVQHIHLVDDRLTLAKLIDSLAGRHVSAIVAPLVNSYKRLVPGYEAPVYLSWARINRSALIRVPRVSQLEVTRLELRCPDPSCNPS